MKVQELMEISDAFKELENKELSFDAALVVAENLEAIRVPMSVANKQRDGLVEKYAERDKDGNWVRVGANSFKIADPEAYSKDLEALFENDVEIGEIKTIPKAALKGISIKPAKLRPILKYIV